MPRPTKNDRKTPRPDRPRPTDAAPRGPKNFKLAVVALTAIALGATFFSGWLLWRGPVGDLVRQYRLLKNPPWRSSDDALRTALAGNPEADRMMSALSALTTTELVLSGRIEVSRLPPDLKSALAADWSNRVTRLCAATLATSQARAAGGDSLRQATAFQRIMNDGPIDLCTLYRDQWWEAWSAALSKLNIGATAYKPGFHAMLTPSASITAAPIGALPLLAGAIIDLSRLLDASGRRPEGLGPRGYLEQALHEVVDSELSIANLMLCADLLVRTTAADPGRKDEVQKLVVSRDEFRSLAHWWCSNAPDWLDITGAATANPPYLGTLITPFAPAALAAYSVVCGASFYFLLVLIVELLHRRWAATARTTEEGVPDTDSRRSHQYVAAVFTGLAASAVGAFVIAMRVSISSKSNDVSTLIWIAAMMIGGFVCARWISASKPADRRVGVTVALLIACIVCASIGAQPLAHIERWLRIHTVLVLSGCAIGLLALTYFLVRRRRLRLRCDCVELERASVLRSGFVVLGAAAVSLGLASFASAVRNDDWVRLSFKNEINWAVSSGSFKAIDLFGTQPESARGSSSPTSSAPAKL